MDADGEEVIGELISGDMDSEQIVIMVDGSEETYDPFWDFAEGSTMFILGSGKKLHVTSPMPDNFPYSIDRCRPSKSIGLPKYIDRFNNRRNTIR